jgi:hypothetical protein
VPDTLKAAMSCFYKRWLAIVIGCGEGGSSQTPNGIPGMEERLPVIDTEGAKGDGIFLKRGKLFC